MSNEKVIEIFDKNITEEVKIQFTEFRGNRYLDIRVWFKDPEGDGESKPTKKGVTVNIDLVPKLKDAILKAAQVLEEEKKS